MVLADHLNVKIQEEQWNHGGVPSQDEAHPETSLRVSKLRELPFKSAGGMGRVPVMNNLFKIPLPHRFWR